MEKLRKAAEQAELGEYEDRIVRTISLRELMVHSPEQILVHFRETHKTCVMLENEPADQIRKACLNWTTPELVRNLELLLLSRNEATVRLGRELFRTLNPSPELAWLMHWPAQQDLITSNARPKVTFQKPPSPVSTPYESRIRALPDGKVRRRAQERLQELRTCGRDSKAKARRYMDGLLEIPFRTLHVGQVQARKRDLLNRASRLVPDCRVEEIDRMKESELEEWCRRHAETADQHVRTKLNELEREAKQAGLEKRNVLEKARQNIEDAVWGHRRAKRQIERLLAQTMQSGGGGMVLGLEGPPGNGKTTLIRNGLGGCFRDPSGNERPTNFIALGGSSGSSALVGHAYTYVGSRWGQIADGLMRSGCMNPIFVFDELDKVSQTPQGRDVIGILTHLTDPSQNSEFTDRYFDGVPLDLSNAILVFTFNDRSAVDPILLDRITVIQTSGLTADDKVQVVRRHMWTDLLRQVGLTDELTIQDETLRYVIHTFTREAGARRLREVLTDLVREANLRRLVSAREPLERTELDRDFVDQVCGARPRVRRELMTKPTIGSATGMWANSYGLGGVLDVQVSWCRAREPLELKLTGQQGEVMKESMACAKTLVWRLLSAKRRKELERLWTSSPGRPSGLHVHVPDGSTPKDGPSAGVAITLALWSWLSREALRAGVTMTGEVDLRGNVKAIGGLAPKLRGAEQAGASLVLIPAENAADYRRLSCEDPPLDLEDETFRVRTIKTVRQALQFARVRRGDGTC